MIPIPPSILAFFAKPIVKFGLPVLLVVAAHFAFQWWLGDVKGDAKQVGVTQERVRGLEHVINSMENASETRRDIADPASSARYDECMRSARTPANCVRFLPK